MSHFIHQFALYFHITIGVIALITFWLPMFARKGSKNHRLFGKFFVNAMYAVSVSGIIMSLLVLADPVSVRLYQGSLGLQQQNFIAQNQLFAAFLLMLSMLTLCNLRQSVLVLLAKAERSMLKSPFHLALIASLALLGMIVGGLGYINNITLLKVFASLCVLNAIGMLHYIFKAKIKQREWVLVHLRNILGAGIATYTAFFAFGGKQLFAGLLTGELEIVPWILPSIVGVSAITYLTKKYRRQLKVADN